MAVYCIDCLNFEEGERIPHPFGPPDWHKERCLAPQNFKDTHKEPNANPISVPRILNKRGNCPWFLDKDSSSSSSSSGGQIAPDPESSSSSSSSAGS